MKKTLLIAAATLAAGIISTQAAVYSQNVVGYINLVTHTNSFNFIAPQLLAADGSNNVNNLLGTGNFVSGGTDPNNPLPSQSVLWIPVTGGGYNNLFYWSSNDLFIANGNSPYGPDGWYDVGLNYASTVIAPGSAVFLQNPSTRLITNTLTGTVVQGSVTNVVHNGFTALSYVAPLGGTPMDSTNVSIPGYGNDGSETAWFWVGNTTPGSTWANLYYWSAAYLYSLDPTYVADGYVPGWYDIGGNYQGAGSSYWPAVGAAFYLQYTGPTTNWVSTFNVQ